MCFSFRKVSEVFLYALGIMAIINLLLGLGGIRVKNLRSLDSLEAWSEILPPPFSWIMKALDKILGFTNSMRRSREIRDETRWDFVDVEKGSQNTDKRSRSSVIQSLEKVYDRFSTRKEPYNYSDINQRRNSISKSSIGSTSKRSLVSLFL